MSFFCFFFRLLVFVCFLSKNRDLFLTSPRPPPPPSPPPKKKKQLYADTTNERAHNVYLALGMKSHYVVFEDMF